MMDTSNAQEEVKFSSLMPSKLDITTDKAEDFRAWHDKWKNFSQYAGLNEQDESFCVASLKSFLADTTLEFVDELPSMSTDYRETVDSIINALKELLCGPVNVVHQRRNFNLRNQEDHESFDDFLNDLMELVKTCEFCTSCHDSLIRDRIVVGLRDADIIDKLLEEADLTLQMAIDICRAEEAANPPSRGRRKRNTQRNKNAMKRGRPGRPAKNHDEDDFEEEEEEEEELMEMKPDPEELLAALDEDGGSRRRRKRTATSKNKNRNRKKARKGIPKNDYDLLSEFIDDDGDMGDGDGDLEEGDDGDDSIGSFPCDKCNCVGRTQKLLLRHDQTAHSDYKPFPCSFCDRSYGLKVSLTRHIQSVHENLKPFECTLCPCAFNKKSSLALHIRSVHDKLRPFACDQCSATFSQTGHLNRHKMIVHDNVRRFQCDQCDKRCTSQTDLNMHIRNNHKGFRCNVCETVFEKKFDLKYHMLAKHQFVKAHLCETCGKSFTTQCSLNTHLTREHGHPEIVCGCRICVTRANNSLVAPGEGGEVDATTAAAASSAEKIRRPHLCELCGKSYTQLPGLKYHMQSMHGVSDKACSCDTCMQAGQVPTGPVDEETAKLDTSVSMIMDRNFKQQPKHRPHKCKLCNASFTQINSLTEHIATVHAKEKKYSCDLCKALFTSHKHLGVHIRSIHLGIKPFDCPHCNAKFSQLGHRNRHVTVVHEGVKKYACELCDKKYASKIDLKYHLKKIHGKVIQFECTLCGEKFEQRKHLMSHIADIHQSHDTVDKLIADVAAANSANNAASANAAAAAMMQDTKPTPILEAPSATTA